MTRVAAVLASAVLPARRPSPASRNNPTRRRVGCRHHARVPSAGRRGQLTLARAGQKRSAKNPADWGNDYDKIREELMSRGPGWADNLPGISNSLNWLSENTFGAAKDLREGIDVLAGYYRGFLDKLPYRRQDGRRARALPKGRAANAHARWEAFKRDQCTPEERAADASPVVGGRDAMLRAEDDVLAYWTDVVRHAEELRAEGGRRKAPGRVGLTADSGDARFVMSEGQIVAVASDTMALVLSLRRAAAAAAAASSADGAWSSGPGSNPSDVDTSADESGDRREELLSGWGGGGNSVAMAGGYGDITPGEAVEATDAAAAAPEEVASRVKALASLLLCTPGDAISAAHRFPAILDTPRSVIAARMASLKELLPGADAAVIFRAEPRLLLAGDGDEIMANVARSVAAIKRELPGVNADKLAEMEPRMLFEDISEGLEALRELWPEEAFRRSEEENPFFAEELALAIKALQGKGKEKPFKSL